MGVVIGFIGVIFCFNGMMVNVMVFLFIEGVRMMIVFVLLVGFVKGILLLVGNGEVGEFSVFNMLFNSIVYGISGFNNVIVVWFMLFFQVVFNFFVMFGLGQVVLIMLLLVLFGDLVGVNC